MLRRARRQADPRREQVAALPGLIERDPAAQIPAFAGSSPTRCRRPCGFRAGVRRPRARLPDRRPPALCAQLAPADRRAPRRRARGDGGLHAAAGPDRAAAAATSEPVRVAIEIDVGYWIAGGRVKIGPKRSPIRTPRAGGGAGSRDRAPAGVEAGRPDGLRGATSPASATACRASGCRSAVIGCDAASVRTRDRRAPRRRSWRRCRSCR